jgi:NADPH:quinone reductase-like Zn-dependent oxidoreductase
MGSLSISYAKTAGYTVVSTGSPHNSDLLRDCGADYFFDHSDPETVGAIRNISPIYWFDTIALRPSLCTLLKILALVDEPVTKANILTLLPLVMTGMKSEDIPEGIITQFYNFSTYAPENAELHAYFLACGVFLEKAIKNGVLKGDPPEVTGGLDTVTEGIEKVRKGVNGKKVVIQP